MRVAWTQRANGHLQKIVGYIARDKPDVAHAVAEDLIRTTEILAQHAQAGRRGRRAGTRELIKPPHLIVYRVKHDVVNIHAIVHGARKYE
ncbi:MAG TPA: type II toxin-antitoxin system RelE/ParE family toxin [Bryobacteraceae bacterium]|jgi:toxin ParE1/3/4|nr:type II toxin-antitoxin system RelE/ParE family toxin [Bryobacteraceae bacterium]